MANELKLLVKSRSTIRARLTNLVKSDSDALKKMSDVELRSKLRIAFTIQKKLSDFDSKVMLLLPEDKVDADVEKAEEYSEKADGFITEVEMEIENRETKTKPDQRETPGSRTLPSAKVKLPKCNLPNFSGKVHEWGQFWGLFSETVDKSALSDIEKFNYLSGCLKGAAKEAIAGLWPTEENYKLAVELLKQRFGRVQLQIEAHTEELLKLSCKDLRVYYDQCMAHIRALKSLQGD